jgi:hypothetical protein
VKRSRAARAAILAAALLATGATTLLPARIREMSKAVEEVRGRRFAGAIAASEMAPAALKSFLRGKLAESCAAAPQDTHP